MTSVSRVFALENPNPTNFSLARRFWMFSDVVSVFLRSWCIASLKVLNYNLEDHLKKVYDCVRFIEVLTQPQSLRICNLAPKVLWSFGQRKNLAWVHGRRSNEKWKGIWARDRARGRPQPSFLAGGPSRSLRARYSFSISNACHTG